VAGAARYKGYRFPIEVIGHAVWLYHRFALSLRDVEELLLARGVVVSHETVRSWCARFGPDYAKKLRRCRPRPGDTWHLDEVFITINGATHYLWRGVDEDGEVLDILVQSKRNRTAAKRFFRKRLKGLQYVPRVLVTDKLGSYGVAHRESMPSGATPPVEVPQQSGRELSSSDQGPRTGDETLRLAGAGPTVPVFVWSYPGPFSASSSPGERTPVAKRDGRSLRSLGRNHRRCGGVKPHCQPTHHGFRVTNNDCAPTILKQLDDAVTTDRLRIRHVG
jgi:putative transposase